MTIARPHPRGAQPPDRAPAAPARKRSAAASAIETLVRARYPLLYVVSWEEERALAEIHRIAESLGKKMFDWTISNGLSRYRAALEGRAEGRRDTKDPLIALKEILATPEPSIFVLRDFHDFMQNSEVKRRLRDLASLLRTTLSTAVIISPLLRLPEELEKDITIVDFPLPDRAELEDLVRQIASDVAENRSLRVDLDEDSLEAILDASVGLTINEAENVFAKTLVQAQRLGAEQAPLVYAEKQQIIRKSGLLEYIDTNDNLSAVGGLDHLKAWIAKRRTAMDPQAIRFGLPPPRGVLLVGVQGCGKSLAAKATANELGRPLVRLDIGRLFSKMVGETESNIRRALSIAETIAPVVLWVDELEKGLSGVGSSDSTDGGTTARLFGTLLTWLQEKTAPVFVVATANDIERLPAEVLRKGRFDEIFFVDLPAESERRDIFAIHLSKRSRKPADFDLDHLAEASEGYSGAEIEQVVVEAMFNAYGKKPEIETSDLLYALTRLVPLSRTLRKSINDRRMWSLGRTVNASSLTDVQQSLERADDIDDEKEQLYLKILEASNRFDSSAIFGAQQYLGAYPSKSDDAERIRLYLYDFIRLCELLQKPSG
ncbi:MAG: AAA family ATPase [Candidatus Sumerlaeaceae bacterium]